MARFREEVLNVALARLLERRGLTDANPETVESGALPDVLIELDGLKLVIEGRKVSARKSLMTDARERIESGLADVSLAVLYPNDLRDADSQGDLERKLDRSKLDGAAFYFSRSGIKSDDFRAATLDQIVEVIRSAYRVRVQNDIVQAQVASVEAAIDRVVRDASHSNLFFASEALVVRLRHALGLPPGEAAKAKPQRTDPDLLRIAIFLLFDAMVFHEVLSGSNPTIGSLRKSSDSKQAWLSQEWERVLHIDYGPIFSIALEVLSNFPTSPTTDDILDELASAAIDVAASGVLSRHDFMGRVYHKLLLRTTGKFYATYYTSTQAAVLLANLALRTPGDDWDFSSVGAVGSLRVIDPACGSGTLLSAAYVAMRDRYVVARPEPLELARLNRVLVEDVIHGWDVLDYAAHLTLTTLALHASTTTVSRSNVYTLPAGISQGGKPQLGSLDLLKAQQAFRGLGFGDPTHQHGVDAVRQAEVIEPPPFDLVIMNPPFSRSSKPKVKFGYANPLGRRALSKDLARVAKALGYPGLSVAGLGAFFMLLALQISQPGARIALVIPRSMLSGVSWRKVRERYLSECAIEFIVSNFDPRPAPGPAPWSWSENTNLGEVLVVARRRPATEAEDDNESGTTTYINVWRRPRNEIQALLLAHQAISARVEGHSLLDGSYAILGGAESTAAVYDVPQTALARNWLAPCALSHPDLNAFGLRLHAASWPSRTLNDAAAAIGPDIAQVKAHFTESSAKTVHRILWGQQAARNTLRLPEKNLGYGIPRDKGAASLHRSKAARLLLADRPHLTTEGILATWVNAPVLATAFWEIGLEQGQCEACFLTWFNSTYGFLEYLAEVTSSRGDIFKAKKDQIGRLRIPQLDSHDECNKLLDSVASQELRPFAEEFALASKGHGVRVLLDRFWADALQLTNIGPEIYDLLATDPVVAKGTADAGDDEEDEATDGEPRTAEGDVDGARASAVARTRMSSSRSSTDERIDDLRSIAFRIELLAVAPDLLVPLFGTDGPGVTIELPGDLKVTIEQRVSNPAGLFDDQQGQTERVALHVATIFRTKEGPLSSMPAMRALLRWLRDELGSQWDGRIGLGRRQEPVQGLLLSDDVSLLELFEPISSWARAPVTADDRLHH